MKIFTDLGERLFPKEGYLLYDGTCGLCRRTIAAFKKIDILGRVVYVDLFDQEALRRFDLMWLSPAALMKDMHFVLKKNSWKGFYAYRRWLLRLPLMWPVVPFLFIWPIPQIGSKIYRRVADSRVCSINPATKG